MNLILRGDVADFPKHCRMLAAFMNKNSLSEADAHAIILMPASCSSDASGVSENLAAVSENLDLREVPAAKATILATDSPQLETFPPYIPEDSLTLLPGNYFGDAFSVLLAARKNGSSLTDVLSLTQDGSTLTAQRSIYSNHMIGTFRLAKSPFVLSIDRNYEELTTNVSTEVVDTILVSDTAGGADSEGADVCESAGHTGSLRAGLADSQRVVVEDVPSQGLTDAGFVVACGRGLRNKKNADYALCAGESLGASVGGTRPVALNGWMPMDRLIGVSRNMIHPKVCLVLAASGSPAFYAGIEKSERIIAVNKDPKAPIFRKADVCIEADWKEVLTRLEKLATK